MNPRRGQGLGKSPAQPWAGVRNRSMPDRASAEVRGLPGGFDPRSPPGPRENMPIAFRSSIEGTEAQPERA